MTARYGDSCNGGAHTAGAVEFAENEDRSGDGRFRDRVLVVGRHPAALLVSSERDGVARFRIKLKIRMSGFVEQREHFLAGDELLACRTIGNLLALAGAAPR